MTGVYGRVISFITTEVLILERTETWRLFGVPRNVYRLVSEASKRREVFVLCVLREMELRRGIETALLWGRLDVTQTGRTETK